MPAVYVGIGGNLGDREATLRAALARLDATPGVRVAAVSSFRETVPVGGPPGQPAYLNAVARLETDLAPRALLDRLLEIERDLGRDRGPGAVRWGARPIDLDLLLYGEREVREPGLIVPHPRMRERAFVMEPLAELGYHAPRMLRIESIAAMRAAEKGARRAGKTVGLVPTMGALHEGHLSLARRARAECGSVFVSIFVNPLQFGPNEDLARYPRDLEGDSRLLETVPVDGVFAARAEEMYPPGYRTYVVQDELTSRLEGASRPGHFRGVLTVVLKLFEIVRPDRAYFGQKDLQQTVVLRRMVDDLNLDLEMVVAPTVREPDGLALSSRNRFLSPEERQDALALSRGLRAAEAAFHAGERSAARLRDAIARSIAAAPRARLDYAEIVRLATLEPVVETEPGCAAVVAAVVGKTRLIDNVVF